MEKIGIVFSTRSKVVLLTLFGIVTLLQLLHMCLQVTRAYTANQGFDVTVIEFWQITIMLFFPFFIVSAVLLRSLTARLAFYRLVKKQLVIAEFSPPAVLTPAEAGLLVDNEFQSEIAATLLQLELDGYIAIKSIGHELTLTQLKPLDTLAPKLRKFTSALFTEGSSFSTVGNGATLLEAGKNYSHQLRESLVAAKLISPHARKLKVYRFITNIFIGIFGLVGTIWLGGLMVNQAAVFTINYPRFPMNISELYLVYTMVGVVIAIIVSGLFQTIIKGSHGMKNWRYVAGLKVYIEKVYKGRFYDGDSLTVSQKELQTFYPYAVALKIENDFTKQLEQAILR